MPAADIREAPESPAVIAALAQLEEALGGRDKLVEALITAPPEAECDRLLGLVADPRNDGRSLASLCGEVNLTLGEFLRLYRDARVAKAQVLALHEVAEKAPTVVRDVMRRAENHYRVCDTCHSTGEVTRIVKAGDGTPAGPHTETCTECGGIGEVLVDASLDHQKLALDLVGLVTKGGPSTVIDNSRTSVTQITAVPFAQLQKAVQKVLDPGSPLLLASPPIEAAVVAPSPAIDAPS